MKRDQTKTSTRVISMVELINHASNSNFRKKIRYGGFSQIWSHSPYRPDDDDFDKFLAIYGKGKTDGERDPKHKRYYLGSKKKAHCTDHRYRSPSSLLLISQ